MGLRPNPSFGTGSITLKGLELNKIKNKNLNEELKNGNIYLCAQVYSRRA